MSENNSDTVEATETASGEERSKANVQSTHNLFEEDFDSQDLDKITHVIVTGSGPAPSTALELFENEVKDGSTETSVLLDIFPPVTEVDSRFDQRWAMELLKNLIQDQPENGVPHISQLVECLTHEAEKLREDAFDLLILLSEVAPGEISLPQQVVQTKLNGDQETRIKTYRLLSRTGEEWVLPVLYEKVENEPGYLKDECQRAINQIEDRYNQT